MVRPSRIDTLNPRAYLMAMHSSISSVNFNLLQNMASQGTVSRLHNSYQKSSIETPHLDLIAKDRVKLEKAVFQLTKDISETRKEIECMMKMSSYQPATLGSIWMTCNPRLLCRWDLNLSTPFNVGRKRVHEAYKTMILVSCLIGTNLVVY